MGEFFATHDELRSAIAVAAARLIAEDGYDYAAAKNKAMRNLVGKTRLPRQRIPSDQEVQEELRAYQHLFLADQQPRELSELREVALSFMTHIPQFEPIVYGAVVNGTASAHSSVHMLVFSDDPKEIDYWLLDQNIAFEACEDALLAQRSYPAVAFQWRGRWFQVGVATPVHRRGLLHKPGSSATPFQTDLNGFQRICALESSQ